MFRPSTDSSRSNLNVPKVLKNNWVEDDDESSKGPTVQKRRVDDNFISGGDDEDELGILIYP